MRSFALCLLACVGFSEIQAQKVDPAQPWSVRMAESEMIRCPESWQLDFQPRLKWDYCHGVELKGFIECSEMYNLPKFFDYARAYCDTMCLADGSVQTYRPYELSLDRINSGKLFFKMYEKTGEAKYKIALDRFRAQLTHQPRNKDGGFWHKLVYPNQMWLDGIYMAEPFYAEYTAKYGNPEDYQEIIRQFTLIAKHTMDPANGLYRHAFDEARVQRWADPETGLSQHVWGRAMGWYAMALVDALEFIPEDTPNRQKMLDILHHVCEKIRELQSPEGLWYQVLDRSGDEGNYLESSVSAMFIYTLYKGLRLGLVDEDYRAVAEKGAEGFFQNFVKVDAEGVVSVTQCCAVAGLGGTPYRSGDYEYYIHEKIRDNDPKTVGPFISFCIERERLGK